MIILQDKVDINTSTEAVFEWLEHFCEHYREWHPSHVSCCYLRGSGLQVSTIIQIEETLHGKLHRLRLLVTEVIPGTRVAYRIAPGMKGAFEVKSKASKICFVATITIGIRFPLLEGLIDALLWRVLASRLAALQEHMAEEGKNLKRLLEQPSESPK